MSGSFSPRAEGPSGCDQGHATWPGKLPPWSPRPCAPLTRSQPVGGTGGPRPGRLGPTNWQGRLGRWDDRWGVLRPGGSVSGLQEGRGHLCLEPTCCAHEVTAGNRPRSRPVPRPAVCPSDLCQNQIPIPGGGGEEDATPYPKVRLRHWCTHSPRTRQVRPLHQKDSRAPRERVGWRQGQSLPSGLSGDSWSQEPWSAHLLDKISPGAGWGSGNMQERPPSAMLAGVRLGASLGFSPAWESPGHPCTQGATGAGPMLSKEGAQTTRPALTLAPWLRAAWTLGGQTQPPPLSLA